MKLLTQYNSREWERTGNAALSFAGHHVRQADAHLVPQLPGLSVTWRAALSGLEQNGDLAEREELENDQRYCKT